MRWILKPLKKHQEDIVGTITGKGAGFGGKKNTGSGNKREPLFLSSHVEDRGRPQRIFPGTRLKCSSWILKITTPKSLLENQKKWCALNGSTITVTEERSSRTNMSLSRSVWCPMSFWQRYRPWCIMHKINIGNTKPIRQMPRRLLLQKREEADKVIQEMESDWLCSPGEEKGRHHVRRAHEELGRCFQEVTEST